MKRIVIADDNARISLSGNARGHQAIRPLYRDRRIAAAAGGKAHNEHESE